MNLAQISCRRAWVQSTLLQCLVLALLSFPSLALRLTDVSDADLDNIYDPGKYATQKFTVSGSDSWWNDVWGLGVPVCQKVASSPSASGVKPARTLLVMVPRSSGEYPVVQLQHGFTLETRHYSQLMTHIASHGYIVVAPQMPGDLFEMMRADASNEISYAAAVVDWYPKNLADALLREKTLLSLRIKPNLEKLVLVGHSRGGKVAFGLATEFCKTSLPYSAIVGLDPVDGVLENTSLKPQVLPYQPNSLHLKYPTMIIGAALGPIGLPLMPPCAPKGVNHEAFFEDSSPAAVHFVVEDYGHMDFLDDSVWTTSTMLCTRGRTRGPMRRFSGGIAIGFLEAVLFNNTKAFNYYLENPRQVPTVTLSTAYDKGWSDSPASTETGVSSA
ncbi:hypothetical protein Mapa_017239 [Marchantia paleacea]|nr:hypothetical protein Mapa_017239 [Marchantia paleacea]